MSSVILPYFSNQLLNCLWRATAITAPTAVFLAAFSGDPRVAGVELTHSNGYDRIAAPAYAAASGKMALNTAAATWPAATGAWTTPWDYIVITDSGTYGAGNKWWLGSQTPRTVIAPNVPKNEIGLLGIQCTTDVGDFFGNKIIDCLMSAVNISPPAALKIAPFNGDPLAGGTELTTGGASRINPPTFSAASGGATANTSSVNWGPATLDWVASCTHLAYIDNTGGAIWAAQPLTVVQIVMNGDVPTLEVGAMQMSFN